MQGSSFTDLSSRLLVDEPDSILNLNSTTTDNDSPESWQWIRAKLYVGTWLLNNLLEWVLIFWAQKSYIFMFSFDTCSNSSSLSFLKAFYDYYVYFFGIIYSVTYLIMKMHD